MRDQEETTAGSGLSGAVLVSHGTISLGLPLAGDSTPTQAGWLARIGRCIAAEHACGPPPGFAAPVPTHQAARHPSTWECLECGQVFALAGTSDEPLPPEPVGAAGDNVIPFPRSGRRARPGDLET